MDLILGGSSRYQKGADNSLIIQDVTADDEGVYTCRAEIELAGEYGERNIVVQVQSGSCQVILVRAF